MMNVDMEEVRKELLNKGAVLLTTEYSSVDGDMRFKCSKCGKPYSIKWRDYFRKSNKNYVCRDCSGIAKPKIEYIRQRYAEKHAKLISTVYENNQKPLDFECMLCGSVRHMSWCNFLKQGNSYSLCPDCNKDRLSNSKFLEIKEAFESKGAVLLVKEYKNKDQKLYFACSNCGEQHYITWRNFRNGSNPNLLCRSCQKRPNYTIEDIRKEFESKGATLITDTYQNAKQKLYFNCSRCGKEHYITWDKYRSGKNSDLFCVACYRGNLYNPDGIRGYSRHNIDNQWLHYVKEFFNLKKDLWSDYSSHHILPYHSNELYRLSIPNGFPLRMSIHARSYVNSQGQKDPYHMIPSYKDLENWPEEAKLDYHTYSGFRFLNLSKYLITTVICRDRYFFRSSLMAQKIKWHKEGKLFIPIYFEEMYDPYKSQILYSILRSKLYRFYKDIYKYTGQELNVYQARKLELQKVTNQEARLFLMDNHMQGFIPASVNYVLKLEGETVQLMSFGPSRMNKDCQYELLRFCSKKNTQVIGGAQRLFTAFLREFDPISIITYCDIRFSSVDPADTVYKKLGFNYDHYSRPNYKYYHPDYNRLFSRYQFQKYKLKEKLKDFDPNLTEEQNMLNNGYIKQYDCGNHVFVWKA